MPRLLLSRPPSPQPQPPPQPLSPTTTHVLPPLTAFSLLLVLSLCLRKIRRERAPQSDTKPPYRFSYSALRRATASFSPDRLLGQGGFGSVFRATLQETNREVAVKVMDAGALQGERELQNELFFASRLDSPLVVSALGFSSDRKRRHMILVYELMPNGNLQDAMLHRKCPDLMLWKTRFSIAISVAKGIEYLHGLDPPVIHGDVKPSNVLLDGSFSAKVADFGLARLKMEEPQEGKAEAVEDSGSVMETESVTTAFDESNFGVDQSPECFVRVPGSATASPETVEVVTESPEMMERGSVSEGGVESRKYNAKGQSLKSGNEKAWWWKQENGVGENGRVKDYVMEWLGTEIRKESPKAVSLSIEANERSKKVGYKKKKKEKQNRRLEWWENLDEDVGKNVNVKNSKERRRPAREWWREEYSEELAKKNKKKKKRQIASNGDCGEDWWPVDDEVYPESRKKKSRRSRSKGSVGSVDWLWDGFSGELWRGRYNSHDSFSGEIPKSGGANSTPSMRGTVCYVAPEYCGSGDLSEKCDVYSFGVLLLVLIAGRRPLEVTGSPLSEFQRANLISWARHLARSGKLLDLVDQKIEGLVREQALLCIIVALLCLQKSPTSRPSMKEVVGILNGEIEPPQLPSEFSRSPQSRLRYKSRNKAR